MAKDHRLRWFVYSDALMSNVAHTDDQRTAAQHAVIKKAAALLQQAHAELQVGLSRDNKGFDHLGRVRAELTAHEEAVTRSFNHLRAAMALIDDGPSDPSRDDGTGAH